MKFGKVITAMVTPFKKDLSVNYEEVTALTIHLVNNGSDGLVVTGTTGESSTLTRQESSEIYRVTMEAVGDKAMVIAGSGANSTKEAVELTSLAEKAGVHASLQVAPYYNKPSQEGFYQHFKTVAESTALPIILYNIPGRTAKNVEAETIIRLAKIPNIVGVKEASGNLEQVSKIVRATPKDFIVYSGDDFLTLPIMCLGGKGVISVSSHLVGKEMREMITAFEAGDVKRSLDIHHSLMDIYEVLFITTNPGPLKAALKLLGRNVGGVRLPLVDVTAAEKKKILSVLKSMGMI
jgi:4-hydroxy-tetrahydrodipicolinate synthase